MRPSKFIAAHTQLLGRSLTDEEIEAVRIARLSCLSGKRDTVKAMRMALYAIANGSVAKN